MPARISLPDWILLIFMEFSPFYLHSCHSHWSVRLSLLSGLLDRCGQWGWHLDYLLLLCCRWWHHWCWLTCNKCWIFYCNSPISLLFLFQILKPLFWNGTVSTYCWIMYSHILLVLPSIVFRYCLPFTTIYILSRCSADLNSFQLFHHGKIITC